MTDSLDDPFTRPDLVRAALVVVDMQLDFLEGGAAPVPGTRRIVPALIDLVRAFRAAALPIVHAVRLYQGDDIDLVRRASLLSGADIVRPMRAGAELVAGVLQQPTPLEASVLLAGGLQHLGPHEDAMWKPRWSAFYRTTLEAHLAREGISTIVIAGCNFPNCPRATIFDASARDMRVVIASDAVSGFDSRHEAEMFSIGARAMPVAGLITSIASPNSTPTRPSTQPDVLPSHIL